MKRPLVAALAGTIVCAAAPTAVAAYPIDCAILLCLAGGFPPSAPCVAARAEMIRRITPWPIEPPLQPWRCPLQGAAMDGPKAGLQRAVMMVGPRDTLVLSQGSQAGLSTLPLQTQASLVWARDEGFRTASMDLSAEAFDFIRAIRVFDVERISQRWSGGDSSTCHQGSSIRLGSYDAEGNFSWRTVGVGSLPAAFEGAVGWQSAASHISSGSDCPGIFIRAVFIEWRDQAGNYDFEQVTY